MERLTLVYLLSALMAVAGAAIVAYRRYHSRDVNNRRLRARETKEYEARMAELESGDSG